MKKPNNQGAGKGSKSPNHGGVRAGAGRPRGARSANFAELDRLVKEAVALATKDRGDDEGGPINDYDPVIEMARIAVNDKYDVKIRLSAHGEVACYVRAKRKALELSGPDGEPLADYLTMDAAVRAQLIEEIAARLQAVSGK